MNYICTWFCADEKGEESIFPQTGKKSSGESHQHIYWRCVILYFATSRRFNKNEKHILFTNVRELPVIDGKKVLAMLKELEVEVVVTDFKYKTPKGYFGMFQNQFYEFSILEYIANTARQPDDQYLIMDSDCIFLKSAKPLFAGAKEQGFMSFEDDCTTDLVIHGLSRINMQALYTDLLGTSVEEIPGYHLGEFFLASAKNIQLIFEDFLRLWPELLRRHSLGLPKFNEEAQTLSYLYYKNNFVANPARNLMKRIWTNPVFYRNAEPADEQLIVWHLPAEKTYGLADLYRILIQNRPDLGFGLTDTEFQRTTKDVMGVPHLSPAKKMKYYVVSYSRALGKRARKAIAGLF
jgi:hypothetical protein